MKTNNKGFSLVELIVVIAIMAILAAVAIPTFASFIAKANFAADKDFMDQAKYAVELAYAADPTFDAVDVEVTLDDGKAVAIKCGDKEIKKEYKGETASATISQEQIDAANAIDWEYAFKTEKGDGTFKVNETAKKLDAVSSNTEGGQ